MGGCMQPPCLSPFISFAALTGQCGLSWVHATPRQNRIAPREPSLPTPLSHARATDWQGVAGTLVVRQPCMRAQYEISKAALEVLQSSKDAKGRGFKVHKVPLPPNLFITQEEAAGLQVCPAACCPPLAHACMPATALPLLARAAQAAPCRTSLMVKLAFAQTRHCG